MSVSGVTSSTSATITTTDKTNLVDEMQDQFMQILLTQLQYQDPMNPMQEQDFFAQMAQFSAATEMADLNTKMDSLISSMSQLQLDNKLLAAANLVGTKFTGVVDGEMIGGTVESAVLLKGEVYVKSGEWLIPLDSLIELGERDIAADEAEGATEDVTGDGS